MRLVCVTRHACTGHCPWPGCVRNLNAQVCQGCVSMCVNLNAQVCQCCVTKHACTSHRSGLFAPYRTARMARTDKAPIRAPLPCACSLATCARMRGLRHAAGIALLLCQQVVVCDVADPDASVRPCTYVYVCVYVCMCMQTQVLLCHCRVRHCRHSNGIVPCMYVCVCVHRYYYAIVECDTVDTAVACVPCTHMSSSFSLLLSFCVHRYYYAIVECDTVDTAVALYKECDGMEFEHSACKMDLRYVPDEQSFESRQVGLTHTHTGTQTHTHTHTRTHTRTHARARRRLSCDCKA